MAKFIKAIFTPDKGKTSRHEEELEAETESPPLDVKRKLSMSRSGRLKQSYKKRQQLSVDVYGESMQPPEKPKSLEYHVHTPTPVTPPKQIAFDARGINNLSNQVIDHMTTEAVVTAFRHDGSKSPEEEIDSAFEVIDKS